MRDPGSILSFACHRAEPPTEDSRTQLLNQSARVLDLQAAFRPLLRTKATPVAQRRLLLAGP